MSGQLMQVLQANWRVMARLNVTQINAFDVNHVTLTTLEMSPVR